jgi:hypothetical protein
MIKKNQNKLCCRGIIFVLSCVPLLPAFIVVQVIFWDQHFYMTKLLYSRLTFMKSMKNNLFLFSSNTSLNLSWNTGLRCFFINNFH